MKTAYYYYSAFSCLWYACNEQGEREVFYTEEAAREFSGNGIEIIICL